MPSIIEFKESSFSLKSYVNGAVVFSASVLANLNAKFETASVGKSRWVVEMSRRGVLVFPVADWRGRVSPRLDWIAKLFPSAHWIAGRN